MSTEDTLAEVDRAVAAGYDRVKIKITPDSCLEKVRAVREKHPDLMIFLDANQSFTEETMDILYKLDALNITCLEEPLDPNYTPTSGSKDLLERLSLLQDSIKTPICLDESVVSARDMHHAMEIDNLSMYAIKIAKFGGIQPALDFCNRAAEHGRADLDGGDVRYGCLKAHVCCVRDVALCELARRYLRCGALFQRGCCAAAGCAQERSTYA